MSEFRFHCPECGQKILCDTGLSGTQIACPTCQKTLTIPTDPGIAPVPVPQPAFAGVAAGNMPPPPAPVRAQAAPRPSSTPPAVPKAQEVTSSGYSALAIASLICSVFVVLGFIPGIICGHLAKKRMRKDIFLEGEKMANVGLIISYSVLGAMVVFALTGLGVRWHFHPVRRVRDSAAVEAAPKARIVDEVVVNENEDDHEYMGQMGGTVSQGSKQGRNAFRGGSFSYTMKVLPHTAMSLSCRYWGSERRTRTFDIAVDDQIIATQTIYNNTPGKFFDVEYKIPTKLTSGKNQVTVEFQAHPASTAGAVFECETLRR